MIYLIAGICIGILVGILLDKYLLPYFDIKFEIFTYKESLTGTEYKLSAQALVQEYNKQYPEIQPSDTNCIGFHMNSDEEGYDYEEDYECRNLTNNYDIVKCDGKKAVGFRLDY